MKNKFAILPRSLMVVARLSACHAAVAADVLADPSNCRTLLRTLGPRGTLHLVSGRYLRLVITGLKGTSSAWITIYGPASGSPAVIEGTPGYNTIEI